MEFHYEKYQDKNDFLRFLLYEVGQRIKLAPSTSHKLKLETVGESISEKQGEHLSLQKQQLKDDIEGDVRSVLEARSVMPTIYTETAVNLLSEKLGSRIEQLMSETEQRMEALTGSFMTGNIELNNHNYQEKLIQLLILISTSFLGKEFHSKFMLFYKQKEIIGVVIGSSNFTLVSL